MSATITFERIGRNHNVAPLTVESDNSDVIAEAVYRLARKHLVSREVDVIVDLEAGQVFIVAGYNNGGGGVVVINPDDGPADPRVQPAGDQDDANR